MRLSAETLHAQTLRDVCAVLKPEQLQSSPEHHVAENVIAGGVPAKIIKVIDNEKSH